MRTHDREKKCKQKHTPALVSCDDKDVVSTLPSVPPVAL